LGDHLPYIPFWTHALMDRADFRLPDFNPEMISPQLPGTGKRYQHRWASPIALGWDWDRRGRTGWFPVAIAPVRSGLYEVRGPGLETNVRRYVVFRGWQGYTPHPRDEWRGLRKGYHRQFSAPYREKKEPGQL